MRIGIGQLVGHGVELRRKVAHFLGRFAVGQLHVQVAARHGVHTRANLSQGPRDQVRQSPVHHHQAHRQHHRKEQHVLPDGGALARLVHIERHDDADGAAHVPHLPTLLGVAGHIQLAHGLAVALQAGLLDGHGRHVAEHLAPLVFREPVVVGQAAVIVESREGRCFVVVRQAGIVAGIEVHEAGGVVRLPREHLADDATGNGAVQPLVHAVLVVHHELPHSVHLLGQGAALLPQFVFHLGMLVLGGPPHVRAKRNRQQHGD